MICSNAVLFITHFGFQVKPACGPRDVAKGDRPVYNTVMIRKVVFPVAGLGTRLLPATKDIPKEMLPVIDKPLIHYAVEEALASGCEEFILVSARGKEALENYFMPHPELERLLAEQGKSGLLQGLEKFYAQRFVFLRQPRPLGFGHAVALARLAVGDEPFAVVLPDDLIISRRPVLAQMAKVFHTHRVPIIALMHVPEQEVDRYGIVAGDAIAENLVEIKTLIEKPRRSQAPSNFAVIGRYILTPDLFPLLERGRKGAGAEIQLTDALNELLKTRRLLGYFFEGRRFDVGTAAGYVETMIEVALNRPDTRAQTRAVLARICHEEKL